MPPPAEPDVDERFKNIMYHWYIVKDIGLEGRKDGTEEKRLGLRKLMEEKHFFKRSKTQYELLFKKWKWDKNHSRTDYQILEHKVNAKRRKLRTDPDVYDNGKLMPTKRLKKELSRHTMTTVERYSRVRDTSPATPPGFQILTPCGEASNLSVFRNLPILNFQQGIGKKQDALMHNQHSYLELEMIMKDGRFSRRSGNKTLDAILPTSSFEEEPTASNLIVQTPQDMTTLKSFSLTTYLLSNNLPGDTDANAIYRWIKTQDRLETITLFSSVKSVTVMSLMETIFHLAIEGGDIGIVKYLLSHGVSPHGHGFRGRTSNVFFDDLDPLEAACINGHIDMALMLLKAGFKVRENGQARRSIIELAITSAYERHEKPPYGYLEGCSDNNQSTGAIIGSRCHETGQAMTDVDSEIAEDSEIQNALFEIAEEDLQAYRCPYLASLLELVKKLVAQGACVEVFSAEGSSLRGVWVVSSALVTAARKRDAELVDFLIERVQYINTECNRGSSVLLRLLYFDGFLEKNQMFGGCCPNDGIWYQSRTARENALLRAYSSRTEHIIWRLMYAGACVGHSATVKLSIHLEGKTWRLTSLDLAVRLGVPLVVMELICRGVTTSGHCFEIALVCEHGDIFNVLIQSIGSLVRTNTAWETAIITAVKYDSKLLWDALFVIAHSFQLGGDVGTKHMRGEHCEVACENDATVKEMNNLNSVCGEKHREEAEQDEIEKWDVGAELNLAIFNCIKTNRFEVFKKLIQEYDPTHLISSVHLTLALNFAIEFQRKDLITMLLGLDVDVNLESSRPSWAYSHSPTYPLLVAIEQGDLGLVNKLLDRGASCEYVWPYKSALVYALLCKNDEIVEQLLQRGANKELVTPQRSNSPYPLSLEWYLMSPLTAAIRMSNYRWILYFLNEGVSVNECSTLASYSALQSATEFGDSDLVDDLLRRGACFCAEKPPTPYWLEFVLERFSWHDTQNSCWRRVIRRTLNADSKYFSSIAWILDQYPDMANTRCEMGFSPLSDAIRRGKYQVAKLLLSYGSNPNGDSSLFLTPLQSVISDAQLDMVPLLLQNGADPNACPLYFSSPSILPRAFWYNLTPLQIACSKGLLEIAEMLIQQGASVDAPAHPEYGATALQQACLQGYMGIAVLLLKHNVNVNAPGAKQGGRTALEAASEHGRLDITRLLLNAGADLVGEEGDRQYRRALNLASGRGHHALRQMLEEYYDEKVGSSKREGW